MHERDASLVATCPVRSGVEVSVEWRGFGTLRVRLDRSQAPNPGALIRNASDDCRGGCVPPLTIVCQRQRA